MKEWVQLFLKKVTWRFLFSYIIVFLVPFLVLSSILTWLILTNTKERIENTNNEGLSQITALLEQQFNKLNDITLDMSINPVIGKKEELSPIEAMDFEKELQRYALFSDIVENIYVYYDSSQRLYTNSGTMDIPALFSQRHKAEQLNPEIFQTNLTTSHPHLGDLKKENPTNLFYFIPFQPNGIKIGEIIYTIPVAKVMSKVVLPLKNTHQNYSIYLNDTKLLSTASENSTTGINNEKNFTRWKKIPGSDLVVSASIPTSVLYQEIEQVLLILISCLLGLLAIGSAIVLYAAYRQYEPVYRLNKLYGYVAKHEGTDIRNIHFDEVGDFLFQQSILVNRTKMEIRAIRVASFWNHLLKGERTDLATIEKEILGIDPDFSLRDHYFLGIVSGDLANDEETDFKLKTLLASRFPYKNERYQVECIEMTYWHQFVFIFKLQTQSVDADSLGQLQKHFADYLSQQLNSKVAINYGDQVVSIDKIHLSYIAVMAQMEEKHHVDGSKPIAYFSYPEQGVMRLKQAIKVGNIKAIETIVHEIIIEEREIQLSTFMRSSYYHYVIQQLLILKEETKVAISFSYQNYAIDFNQIEAELKRLAFLLSHAFSRELETREREVDQEILQMIQQHYMKPHFSLEEMAIKFGVSLSKMSIMVKQETNVSFSKYVQALRIEQVKKELLETSKPVKEIIMDVGYYDVANFTRKFREVVGVPPGQFRKIHEEKKKC